MLTSYTVGLIGQTYVLLMLNSDNELVKKCNVFQWTTTWNVQKNTVGL